MKASLRVQFVDVHGHRRAFVKCGHGPALLLLHGVACDHTTWDRVIRPLARNHTVIAPDLLGHGRSDKPRGDYSVGAFANGMRDLLSLMEIDRATVVGHSFGGGVAMQFAYQFPELTERLVLVAPGGLGREVSPLIRMAAMPGFHQLMGALTLPGIRQINAAGLRIAHAARLPGTRDVDEIAAIYEGLRDPQARSAVGRLLSAVVDRSGQVVTMNDRAYLTEQLPLAIIWGAQDPIIPAEHARRIASLLPAARVEIIDDSGHFPHRDHSREFLRIVQNFLATTQPSPYDQQRMRELLRGGRTSTRPVRALTG